MWRVLRSSSPRVVETSEARRSVCTATMIKLRASRHELVGLIVLLASVVSARSLFSANNESVPMADIVELTWQDDFLQMPASGTFCRLSR